MSQSAQKTVLITGCSAGGIGHALAEEFHARGLRVFPTARSLDSMKHLTALGMQTFRLDVTDDESVRSLAAELGGVTGGRLDILVNNAGQGLTAAATDLVIADAQALFDVNVFGAMRMVAALAPLLIAAAGHIVQVGSIAALVPLPFGSAYSATKAALHAYGNTLRLELAPFNVKVTTVMTGAVKSQIGRPAALPAGSLYTPMAAAFTKKHDGSLPKEAIETKDYARTVVAEALRTSPRALLWAGGQAWTCWFMDTFLWRGAFDPFVAQIYGMNAFAKQVKGEKVAHAAK